MSRAKIQLGELLIQHGLITPADLEKALKIQKEQPNLRIGDILVKIGVLTQEELISFLSKQFGIPYIDLSNFLVDTEALTSIPKNLVEEHKVVPLKKEGNKIVVAMVDPLDVIALDNISQATGFEIKPVIATESDIERFINQYYQDIEIPQKQPLAERTTEILLEEDITSDTSVIQVVDSLIYKAYSLNASDFHIEPRENDVRIRYRIDGVTWDSMPLPKEIQNPLIARFKILANLDITETRLPQEGRFQTAISDKQVDVRVSIIPTLYGEKVAVRIFKMETSLLKLDQLGMDKQEYKTLREIIHNPYGLIIISGPVGSGKSTTFYAILQELNIPQKSIITLEDPVEYPVKNVNQVSINPRAGFSYSSALQSILRQLPDIVMIGEIKDRETAQFALDLVLAGGLVITTMHGYDAISALTRIINMEIEPYLICSSLLAVVAQKLVRILCPFCKEAYNPTEEELQDTELTPGATLYRRKGCKMCNYTGYKGRTGIFEILKITPQIQNLIMQKSPRGQILQVAKDSGFITIKEKIISKVQEGVTSLEELSRLISSFEEVIQI